MRGKIFLTILMLAATCGMATDEELLEKFAECAERGQLEECIARNHTFNVESATLGGFVWWRTYVSNGWLLQINRLSGWWRILDANHVRRARGTSMAQLRHLLNDRPTSVMMNYLDRGFHFSRTAAKFPNGRCVVLLHGWGVRASSMQELANELSDNGYDVYNYDYPSSKLGIDGHAQAFLTSYRILRSALPTDAELYFLTHSMGALLLRGALSNMTLQECRQIRRIVMLGPPNRGSSLAYFAVLPLVSDFNASLADMMPNEASYVSNLKEPPYMPPVGIIAGNMDGKVSIDSTRLPDALTGEHIVVSSTHPGLRKPKNVLQHVLDFFETGAFKRHY